MERKALVKGEIHRNQTDRENILEHDLDSYDAIFVEARKDSLGFRDSPIYNLFAAGYVFHIMMILPLVGFLAKLPKKAFPLGTKEIGQTTFRSKLKRSEAVLEDGSGNKVPIDAEISEIFDFLGRDRYIAALIPLILLGSTIYVERAFYLVLLAPWFVPWGVFAISVLLIVMKKGSRNEHMADKIEEISKDKDYEDIMVICGDRHVPGIKSILENKGFKTRKDRSDSLLAKILRKTFRD